MTGPRCAPDPVCSAPVVVAFCLASYAAVAVGAYVLVRYLIERR